MIQQSCGWDGLVFVFMLYAGIPGAVGVLGSIVEAIAMLIVLLIRKESKINSSIGTQTQFWIFFATLSNIAPFILGALGLLVPGYARYNECANLNIILTRITSTFLAVPFFMAIFFVFSTFNLHKHVQHVSLNSNIHLQQKSRRVFIFSAVCFVLTCISFFFITIGTTQSFGFTYNDFPTAMMIVGQFLQMVTAILYLALGIIMHRLVAQTRAAMLNNASSTSIHANDVLMLEIRATSAVNLVNGIYLFLAVGVLPATSTFMLPFAFSKAILNVGIFLVYPVTPLLQAIAVLVMIIIYYVVSAEPSDKKSAELQQAAVINHVEPVTF